MTQPYPPGQSPFPPSAAQSGFQGTLGYAPPPASGGKLIDIGEVGRRQKAVMYCLLAQIAFIISFLTLGIAANPRGPMTGEMEAMFTLVATALGITTAVFVVRLAWLMYSGGAIVFGLLILVPMLGIIILLVVNAKATNLLRQHGIKVGLMGAKAAHLPAKGILFAGYPTGMNPTQSHYAYGGFQRPPD